MLNISRNEFFDMRDIIFSLSFGSDDEVIVTGRELMIIEVI
jgi:hypothetical protein